MTTREARPAENPGLNHAAIDNDCWELRKETLSSRRPEVLGRKLLDPWIRVLTEV